MLRWALCLLAVACSGSAPPVASDAQLQAGDAPGDASIVDPGQSTLTVDRLTTVAGLESVTLTLTVRDSAGSPVPGIDVVFVATGAMNTISQPPLTNAQGSTSATWTSSVAETKVASAIIGSVTVPGPTVTFSPGLATTLAFVVQPADVIAGDLFTPALRVEAQDAFGNLAPSTSGDVTLSLETNPVSTTLRGSTIAALEFGVATFAAAHVDVASAAYTLRAHSPDGLTHTISEPFDVAWGPPASTTIAAAPSSLEANGIDTASVTMHVANANGIALPGHPVSISISGSNNMLAPSSGMTNAQGDFVATLASSTAEMKTLTGTAGAVVVTGTVTFHAPSCRPRLPGIPAAPVDAYTFAMHVGDIDADGHRDAVVATVDLIRVYRGRGDGTFKPPVDIDLGLAGIGIVRAIESGDFNGDGHVDLVIASDFAPLHVFIGAGNGQFGPPTATSISTTSSDVSSRLAVADFNKDGKLDVATSSEAAASIVIGLGTGTGTFIASQTISAIVSELAVADVNDDGFPDLLFSDYSRLGAALGVGNGTFQASTSVSASGGFILSGQINSDSRLDVVIASPDGRLESFAGAGDGTFTLIGSAAYRNNGRQNARAMGGAIRDLDGDGQVDVVVGSALLTSVLKGSGTGAFTLDRQYYAPTHTVTEMTGDGVVDLVGVAWHSGVTVVAGTASTAFVAPVVVHRPSDHGRLFDTSADFDGNGRPDYVRYNDENIQQVNVLLTQLHGGVVEAPTAAFGNAPSDVVAGDFTGDGNQDVAMVRSAVNGVTLGIAAGNGTGALAAFSTQGLASPPVTNLLAADLDKDGRQDLLLRARNVAGFSTALSLGNSFAAPQTYSVPSDTLVVADVNGDDIPDVVAGGGTGIAAQLNVYLGTGTGGLTVSASLSTLGLTGMTHGGDMTGDGIVDLVFIERGLPTAFRSVAVFPGLGGGAFADPIITPTLRIPDLNFSDIRVFDITEDGHLDLVLSSMNGTTVVAGFGNGYVRQTPMHYTVGLLHGSLTDPVVAADHDADGRVDFVQWHQGLVVARNVGCAP